MRFGRIFAAFGLALAALSAGTVLFGSGAQAQDAAGDDALLELQRQNDAIHNSIVDPEWKRDLKQKNWDYQSKNLAFESQKLELESQRTALALQQQQLKLRQQEMDNQTRVARGREKALSNPRSNLRLRDYSVNLGSSPSP